MKNLLVPALIAALVAPLNAQPMRNPAPRGPQIQVSVQAQYPYGYGAQERRRPAYGHYPQEQNRCKRSCCAPVYNPRGMHEAQHNGCAQARGMSQADYRQLLNYIDDRSFDSDRLALAKQACLGGLQADQIAGIMDRFSFESSRLAFAKYAYDYCIDPQNYYRVNSAFAFSSSIQDLDRHLRP